jgi:biopolymer transport protein ExbD
MRYRQKSEESVHIDVTNLIDVVMILLFFFVISTSFVKDMQLNLERPSASSGTAASTKSVRIYIDRSGNIFHDEQPVKLWMLQSLVRDSLATSSTSAVLVIADTQTSTQALVDVIDQCRLAGAADVGVATEAK